MGELTLAIETSNPSADERSAGSVCLGTFDAAGTPRVIAHHALSPASRHDDALMPAVDAVCHQAGVSANGLGRVAVSIGPGGFTSVRIAVTTAKMICEATGAACIGVPTALALAHRAAGEPFQGTLGVLLAWKREDVWRQRFRIDAGAAPDDQRITALDAGTIVPLDESLLGCDAVTAEDALAGLLAQHPDAPPPPPRRRPSSPPASTRGGFSRRRAPSPALIPPCCCRSTRVSPRR